MICFMLIINFDYLGVLNKVLAQSVYCKRIVLSRLFQNKSYALLENSLTK